MRRLLQIVLLAAVTPWACAQGTAPAKSPSPAKSWLPAPAPGVRGLPFSSQDLAAFQKMHARGSRRAPLFPFGLFSDSLFPDNPSSSESPAPTPSPFNLIEALSALNKTQEPPPPASQPLLIELQGDRYVRLNSGATSEPSREDHEPIRVIQSQSTAKARSSVTPHQPTARELPPAVLIFRDGHSEEARDYTIVGGVMYARGDYYIDGYWNKKIELSSLNLPETLKSNEARGVHFILPNAPNEVVTRP